MLTIEQQVTLLELSMKLDELGVKGGSIFRWHVEEYLDDIFRKTKKSTLQRSNEHAVFYTDKYYDAYTAAELLAMLPKFLLADREEYHIKIWFDEGLCFVGYYHVITDIPLHEIGISGLEETLGRYLEWLLTKGHVTVDEINKEVSND